MRHGILLKHYVLESGGRETRIAKFAKFFGRNSYYHNMGLRLKNPALATRLELIDRRSKEAALLCPHKAGNAFREFLSTAATKEELDEKVRLLQEIVLQLRANAQNFQEYSFSVTERIADLLGSLGRLMPSTSDEIGKYHARVHFTTSLRCTKKTKIYDDIPYDKVHLVAQLEPFDKLITTCTYMTIGLMKDVPSVAFWRWDEMVRDARRLSVRLGISSGIDNR